MDPELKLFGGTSNPELTLEVSRYLGIDPGKITAETFSDGETLIEIGENIRGRDVFVLQSTCMPVNDNLMQLLIIMDALRRASAKRISSGGDVNKEICSLCRYWMKTKNFNIHC